MRWKRWIFVRNAVIAVKAVKINISPYFTAFLTKTHRQIHRNSHKNSTHRLLWQINVRTAVKAVNALKKNKSPHFTAFLSKIYRKIHRISYKNSPHMISKVYSIWFKFTRNFQDLSYSWCRWLSSCRDAGGQRFEPLWGRILFVRIQNAVKINNSPRFTAFTAKRCKKNAVKNFLSLHFTAFLTKIHRQTSIRVYSLLVW